MHVLQCYIKLWTWYVNFIKAFIWNISLISYFSALILIVSHLFGGDYNVTAALYSSLSTLQHTASCSLPNPLPLLCIIMCRYIYIPKHILTTYLVCTILLVLVFIFKTLLERDLEWGYLWRLLSSFLDSRRSFQCTVQ